MASDLSIGAAPRQTHVRPRARTKWKALAIGLLLSVLLPLLAFQGVDVSQSWELIRLCLGWELALGGFFFLITLGVRAWRWKYLLAAQQTVGMRSCLSATCVGLMANNILPFRLGDLVRVSALRHLEGGSGARVLATVAVERILDILTLVLFLGAYLAFAALSPEGKGWGEGVRQGELLVAGFLALGGGLAITLVLIAGYWRRQWVQRLVAVPVGWISPRLGQHAGCLTGRFLEGLHVIASPRQVMQVLVLSLALWGAAVLSYYFVGQAVGLNLPVSAYMVVVFATAFGAIIPAAPGAVGTFHGFARLGLYLVAVHSGEQALAFAAVLHATEWLLTNVAGLYFLARDRLNLTSYPRRLEDSPAGLAPGEFHATPTPSQA